MAADDGRGSQRGARESASSRNSNTNNSARGDARGAANTDGRGSQREARESAASSRSQAGTGGGGTRSGNTNNGQSGARESRPGADGRGSQREARASAASTGRVGGGLAGAAGLGGQSIGGNVTSTYQGRPASVASAALSRQSLAPDRQMPTGPARNVQSATGFGPIGDMAANAYGAVKSAIAPTFNRAMEYNSAIDGFVDKMIGVESGNNPKAKNPLSSATGLGQFINSTWTNTVAKYRPDLTANYTKPEVLAMRTDPVLAREMTKALAIQTAEKLVKNGITPTAGKVYLGHFLGEDAAVRALKANPDTPISNVVSNAVISANRGVFNSISTVGGLTSWADRKMKSFEKTPESVGVPPARPGTAERFSKTYLGGPQAGADLSTRAPITGTGGFASTVAGRPAGPISQNPNAGYTPRAADPSLMSDAEQAATFGEQPGGAPVAPREIRPTSPSPTTVDPAYSVRPVSPTPNSPQIAPTVPSTPVPAVKATPVAPSEETTVKVPLTTGQKIAAGAVDVGVGMIPGVGLAATVYNGLATLTGQPTIGGMAVDLLGGGFNLGQQGASTRGEGGRRSDIRPGSDPIRSALRKQGFSVGDDEADDSISDVPETPGKRFRERYLIPTIKRPTPAEKWGRRRASA